LGVPMYYTAILQRVAYEHMGTSLIG